MTTPPSKHRAAACAEPSGLAIAVGRTVASARAEAGVFAPPSRARQKRSTAMVADILEAAVLVVEEKGAAGYNTNAVAERAGVSIGSLYQYFANKADLTHALMEREDMLLERKLADMASGPTGLPLLSEVIWHAAACRLQRPALARLLAAEAPRLPPSRHASQLTERLESVFRRSFEGTPLQYQPQAAADIFSIMIGLMENAGHREDVEPKHMANRLIGAVFGYVDAFSPGQSDAANVNVGSKPSSERHGTRSTR